MKLGMYKRNVRLRPTHSVNETTSLGEAMLLTRLSCKLTQEDAARLLGTGQNRISEYENNIRTPSKRTIHKWINATQCFYYYSHYMKLYQQAFNQSSYKKQNKLKTTL